MDLYTTDELIEATYLFCRKRVNDGEAAKDLAQDILYEALKALAKGVRFYSFYSWYWKMARNKYADYIKSKNDTALPLDIMGGAVSDFISPVESLISAEEISRLNFSLSRLASIHREIIIRYYLKEQSVAQIASDLDIPQGTVKGRLFDARKNLKERINDMNSTGRSAYAPADVNWFFGFNCCKASNAMSSKIAQQTVVFCRSEAKTAVEISDEIGVAPVYLEEILEEMLREKLLIQPVKNKYQSNFCVFPEQPYANAQYEAYAACLSNKISERTSKALTELKNSITSLDFYGNDFDYSYLMWILYVIAGDRIGVLAREKYLEKCRDKYPDEPERDYRITARFTMPEETVDYSMYGNNWRGMNWSNLHEHFKTADFGIVEYINDFEYEPFPASGNSFEKGRDKWIDGNNVSLLLRLAQNPAKALNKYEQEKAADFIEKGLVTKTENGLRVNLPIMTRAVADRIQVLIADAVRPIAEEYAALAGERSEKILLPYVRRDLMSNFIHWDMRMFFQPTCQLFYYGLHESDYLKEPEDYSRSAAALWIITE